MGPRKELKDALAYEKALLDIYRTKIPPEYAEVAEAFERYLQDGENRVSHLRRLFKRYCSG